MFAISNVCFAQSYNNVEEEMLEEETLEYSVSSSNGLPDNVTDEIFVFLETVGNAMLDAIIDFFNIGIWWISALALPLPLLTAFIIKRMRKADKLYKHPQRYYLLYLGGVVLTFISSYPYAVYMEICDITHLTAGHILLSIGVSSFSSLAIFAGWGIRQCGMISGKYHRNFNRYMGQLLLLPAWLFTLTIIGNIGIAFTWGIIGSLSPGDYGFMVGIITIILEIFICYKVFKLWVKIVSRYLYTAGNLVIHITSLSIWFILAVFWYNWIDSKFNGLVYVLILFIGGTIMLTFLSLFIKFFVANRCPMCHDCHGVQTDYIDHGVSYQTTRRRMAASESEVEKSRSNAVVVNPEKVVETVTGVHHWTTKHTCPVCRCTWSMWHSEEVSEESRTVETSHTELY